MERYFLGGHIQSYSLDKHNWYFYALDRTSGYLQLDDKYLYWAGEHLVP